MRTITTLIGTGILALLASCSSSSSISDPNASHTAFKSQKDYKASYTVYKDEKILADSSAKATKLVIDRTNQRALLYVGNKVAIDSPTTTGKAGKVTPAGSFKVTEKIKTKRSTIFGTLYKNGRRVYGGDKRKYHGSYDKYVGSPLPYWMLVSGYHTLLLLSSSPKLLSTHQLLLSNLEEIQNPTKNEKPKCFSFFLSINILTPKIVRVITLVN